MMVPNRPTEVGKALGANLARLCDAEEIKLRERLPDMAERCKSCAFRAGTIPNGCPETLMDAIKASIEWVPFLCHERLDVDRKPHEWCAGWFILAGRGDQPGEVSWPFSDEPDAEARIKAISENKELQAALGQQLRTGLQL